MRMTSRKKEILSYFEPDNLEWVTGEIGAPPFDVSGVAYLLHAWCRSISVTSSNQPGAHWKAWLLVDCLSG